MALGVNVMLIAQLAPAANEVPQLLVCAKLEAFVPDSVMLVIAMLAVPVLDRVTTLGLLVVFTRWLPNETEVDDRLATGAKPTPVSETVCGLPVALSVTESVAVRVPAAEGVNVTLMLQLAPIARETPQVVVRAKLLELVPEIAMLLMLMLAAPVFVSTTTWAALVVLRFWLPKLTEVGDNEATGTPVELKVTPVTFPPLTETDRLVGVKV